MSAFDFWRLPPTHAALSDSEDEGKTCTDSRKVDSARETTQVASTVAAFAPPARTASTSEHARDQIASKELPPERVAEYAAALKEAFQLDESALAEITSCPVPLASLAEYVCDVRSEKSEAAIEQALASHCNHLGFPAELRVTTTLAESAPGAATSSRSLCSDAGRIPIDRAVSGPIGDVPALPKVLTITEDVPALIEQMLSDVPANERDSKKFHTPHRIQSLPSLNRGCGGVLPLYTPREVAQNAVAAAILTRLCGNVLSVLSACVRDQVAVKQKSPEELAHTEAQEKLREAKTSLREAKVDEASAQNALREYRIKGELDMDTERDLESRSKWKSAVCKQVEAELAEAERTILKTAAALEASKGKDASQVWHSKWASPLPLEAASEPLFGVRLAPTAPIHYTIKNFIEAMQNGFVDRQVGGFVPKHSFEVAFVRQAADSLMLCRGKDDQEEKLTEYTHMPAPATVSTGMLSLHATGSASHSDEEALRTVRPHHGQLIRVQGTLFSFGVLFTAVPGSDALFLGVGTHALAHALPWNPVEYGDVLWQQEAMQSLVALPLIVSLASVVWDPTARLGIFPPVRPTNGLQQAQMMEAEAEVPAGSGTLALLQAALFEDVKMWPVALPDAARVRWDYALRTVLHALLAARRRGDCGERLEGPLDEELDSIRDEVVPQCLRGLPKVPNDSGAGDAGGCRGFGDRLKRMEMSALLHSPLASASKFRRQLELVAALWPGFAEDCAVAPP
eukprot:TRINITY_DN7806_c1_g2_i1.p1 TRINITY_DN7806_c1_g2~~TRINITY_DN7806_c1_g2_i1.p1  ORF type:complete len:752 (+),score=147.49 TRINITY_DN7806_c1_g2_i1:34-2256(+)